MGVKVVSVERRDTPTRYDLFHVQVVYDIDESDVPTDRMVFRSLFSPIEGVKTMGCCCTPPPAVHFTFERTFAGISRGYRYWLDYDLFSKI
jgi:hypothetical protein